MSQYLDCFVWSPYHFKLWSQKKKRFFARPPCCDAADSKWNSIEVVYLNNPLLTKYHVIRVSGRRGMHLKFFVLNNSPLNGSGKLLAAAASSSRKETLNIRLCWLQNVNGRCGGRYCPCSLQSDLSLGTLWGSLLSMFLTEWLVPWHELVSWYIFLRYSYLCLN